MAPRRGPFEGPLRALATNARAWLLAPITRQLQEMTAVMALDLNQLQQAVTRSGSYAATVATLVPDLRGKLAALTTALAEANSVDQATKDQLAAITASADATADLLAQATADPVNDSAIPTGPVEAPPATNPATPDPESVEGSVPAGEPLPAELDPSGQTTDNSPGADAVDQAAADAESSAADVVGSAG